VNLMSDRATVLQLPRRKGPSCWLERPYMLAESEACNQRSKSAIRIVPSPFARSRRCAQRPNG
jgi:hypothetical protein